MNITKTQYNMTQEDKELLLKDLCARLPYGVICRYDCAVPYVGKVINYDRLNGIITIQETIGFMVGVHRVNALFDNIKPYLRPMSSMTEEEKKELNNVLEFQYYSDDSCMCESTDWLNAHHFDYRGLIEKVLAIEVTEENNPYKE